MMMSKIPKTFSVFPVNGKIPAIKWHEYITRLPTIAEKEEWSKKYKEFGIATGPISKVLVLDDDGSSELKDKFIPHTWSQHTPRGGRHYFFKWIPELDTKVTTKTGILNKVDVRGQGGYVRFYGFIQPYTIVPLALPPKWLVDLLPDRNKPDPNKVWSEVEGRVVDIVSNKDQTPGMLGKINKCSHSECIDHEDEHVCVEPSQSRDSIQLIDKIKEGNRDDSFTRIAGSLRAKGYDSGEIFSLLHSKAQEVGFTDWELKKVCNSISKHAPKTRSITDDCNAPSISSFLLDEEVVEWIVPGIFAKQSIGFVAGLPETYKTWILIDLAVEAAKPKPASWLGQFSITERLKVIFVDQERFKGETQRRFRAVIKGKGLQPEDLQDNLFIRCGTTTRIDLLHSYEAFRKVMATVKPDLVIVDSFVTFHTKQENSRQDIQEVLERIKELRNEFGSTFLFVHHENKNAFLKGEDAEEPSIAQMAGNVAIPAAAETVLTVRKHGEGKSMVYHTKSTLGNTQEPFMINVIDMDEKKEKIKVEGY